MTWLSDLVGQYRRRYFRQIANENRIWSARGPRSPGSFALRLEKIYVDLRVASSSVKHASLDVVTAQSLPGSARIWDFLHELEEAEAAPPIVLLGAPGAGKSTLLQHVALTLSVGETDLRRANIPLLLSLREHAGAIAGPDPPTLGALAYGHFGKIPAHAPVPEGWFEKKLQTGRCAVLLDGLGEISSDDERARVVAWIDQQVAMYPGALFVVATRPAGYRDAQLEAAVVLEIQPFMAPDVEQFIQGWHQENEIMRALGHEDENIRERALAKANDLLGLIERRPALAALSRSPLLLTMLATVHSRRGPLPGRCVDLYAEICQVLLGEPLAGVASLEALARLAAHMTEQRIREISSEAARAVLELEEDADSGVGIDRFLRDVEAASGLLFERQPRRWAFAHRTFQEYLTAVHFRGQPPVPLASLIEDAWWQEVLLFHAALGDATPMLEACLAWGTVPALTLAGECMDEASEIDPEVRAQVEQRISADAESADAERRHLTAAVWIARRASARRPIDGRRAIDVRFVTTAEYQLFLDEMRTQGELFYPDHWAHHRFLPGDAKEPVRGVRAEDAGRFAHWLSRRRGDRVNYRLPTVEEAKAYPAEEEDEGRCIAAWCRNGGRYRLVGLSSEEQAALMEQLRPRSTIPPPPSLSFNLVRILDLTRDRDLDLDLAIVIALALSNALVHKLDLGQRLLLALARLRDRISSRDLARALAHARARARELDFDRDQTLAVALRPAFELLYDLARTRAHAVLDDARAEQQQKTLDRALSLARDLGEEEILGALLRRDFLAAYAFVSLPGEPGLERVRATLQDALTQLRADGPPDLLKEQRLSDVRLVEVAWVESGEVSPEQEGERSGMARRTMAELSWWIHVILARRAGLLPAWEGIRLVQEQPRA